MDRSLERIMGEAITGARKAQTMADELEMMFEMWTGYMTATLGVHNFINRLQTYDDRSFNMDGYQPTIMPVCMKLIEGMTSIGVDVIKPNPSILGIMEPYGSEMLLEESMNTLWLIFTVVEQGHALKGLRYVTGFRDGELTISLDDPQFTTTYDDDEYHVGGQGFFIDKRERFLRHVRGDIFQ